MAGPRSPYWIDPARTQHEQGHHNKNKKAHARGWVGGPWPDQEHLLMRSSERVTKQPVGERGRTRLGFRVCVGGPQGPWARDTPGLFADGGRRKALWPSVRASQYPISIALGGVSIHSIAIIRIWIDRACSNCHHIAKPTPASNPPTHDHHHQLLVVG